MVPWGGWPMEGGEDGRGRGGGYGWRIMCVCMRGVNEWRANEEARGYVFVSVIAGERFMEFELYFIYAIMMQFCCWR